MLSLFDPLSWWLLGRKAMTNLDNVLKSGDSADKGTYSYGYGLPSGHIQFWELDHKEGKTPKNWCFQTVVLEKTPESPLDYKEIKPVNLRGNQHWILIGGTDVEAEAPAFWSSDANSWLIGKVPDAGKDWGWIKGEHQRWDGWMASPMQWTWTWANFGKLWGTGKLGVQQSMELQRITHKWAAGQQEARSHMLHGQKINK